MIEIKGLLKPAKRYRGFVSSEDSFLPVTMNLFPVDGVRVRLKNLFPTSLRGRIGKGTVVFLLLEEDRNSVAELRVIESGDREALALVDFVSEDRRKLPRVKVAGTLEVKAVLECGGRKIDAVVYDVSLTSVRLSIDKPPPSGDCLITFILEGSRFTVRGRVIRSEKDSVVVRVYEEGGAMTGFLSKIYSLLFLKIQRGFQS